jgi:hypothetical protein
LRCDCIQALTDPHACERCVGMTGNVNYAQNAFPPMNPKPGGLVRKITIEEYYE